MCNWQVISLVEGTSQQPINNWSLVSWMDAMKNCKQVSSGMDICVGVCIVHVYLYVCARVGCMYVCMYVYVTAARAIRTPRSALQTSVGTNKAQWSLLSGTPIFSCGEHSSKGHPSK